MPRNIRKKVKKIIKEYWEYKSKNLTIHNEIDSNFIVFEDKCHAPMYLAKTEVKALRDLIDQLIKDKMV